MTPPAAAASRSRPSRPAPGRAAARRPAAAGRPTASARAARGRGAAGRGRPTAARGSSATVRAPSAGPGLLHALAALPDSRLVDRMVRGRVWIAVLAVGLVGIVFLQISLLKLNTGISRAVETQQTFERQNASLKTELSSLGGGERIKSSAAAMGFVSPATGQPRFVNARGSSATRAAANISAPAPIQQLPLGMIAPEDGGTGASTPDPASALAAGAASAATPPADAPVAATPPAAAAPVPEPELPPVAVTPAPAAVPAATDPAPAPTAAAGGLAATGQG